MKPDNWNRFAAGLLAILLCLCSFSMPAFASGTDPAPEPLPEIIEEEPTTGGMEPEGVPTVSYTHLDRDALFGQSGAGRIQLVGFRSRLLDIRLQRRVCPFFLGRCV